MSSPPAKPKPPTMYMGAPGMLMDRIHVVREILSKSKLQNGETASWKSWNKTADIMMYAWEYMQSLNWVLKDNHQLRGENAYMRERLAIVEAEVNIYRTIRTCVIEDNIEEKIEVVKLFMDIGIEKIEGIFRD